MTTTNAAKKLLSTAIINHSFTCSCVKRGVIKDSIPCDCGASQHNQEVMEAYQWLVRGLRNGELLGKLDFKVGIESPTYKFGH